MPSPFTTRRSNSVPNGNFAGFVMEKIEAKDISKKTTITWNKKVRSQNKTASAGTNGAGS